MGVRLLLLVALFRVNRVKKDCLPELEGLVEDVRLLLFGELTSASRDSKFKLEELVDRLSVLLFVVLFCGRSRISSKNDL